MPTSVTCQHGHVTQQLANGPYACGLCAGTHPTEQCTLYMPGAILPPTKCWCMVCKWNTTHVTENCLHIARKARELEAAARPQGNFPMNFQQGYVRQEMSRPILGAQPLIQGAVPVRYVETKCQEPFRESASIPLHYQEPITKWYDPCDEFVDPSKRPYVTYPAETNSMLFVDPRPTRTPQQSPMRRPAPAPPLRQGFPPVQRFCAGCGVDHLPRNCPTKQIAAVNQGPDTSLNYMNVVPPPNTSAKIEAEKVSVNVVTRAKINKNNEMPNETKTKAKEKLQGKKQRQRRRKRSKGSKKSKGETPKIDKSQEKSNKK